MPSTVKRTVIPSALGRKAKKEKKKAAEKPGNNGGIDENVWNGGNTGNGGNGGNGGNSGISPGEQSSSPEIRVRFLQVDDYHVL